MNKLLLYADWCIRSQDVLIIGIGAGPAGPVWPDHSFWGVNEIHYRYILRECLARTYYCWTTSKVLPMPMIIIAKWLVQYFRHFQIDKMVQVIS